MPAGERTRLLGMGPMTGWGMGHCGWYAMPGWAARWPGYRHFGRGGGRGWRHWFYATGLPRWARWGIPPAYPPTPPSREQELEMLRDEAEWLKEQLDAINRYIEEFKQE